MTAGIAQRGTESDGMIATKSTATMQKKVHTKTDYRPNLQRKDKRMEVKTGAKKVFICSPFRGLGRTEQEAKKNYLGNMELAKKACRYATGEGCIPYCPHLYFPRFLVDSDPDEREIGMLMGQTWLKQCSELWVIGRRISQGMKSEIAYAKELGIPVKHYVPERTPEERLLDAILRPEIEYREMV